MSDDTDDRPRYRAMPPAALRAMAPYWRKRLQEVEARIQVEEDERWLEHLAAEWHRISGLLARVEGAD